MTKARSKDPRQLPVQLNVQVPWSFREFLIERAKDEGLSLNKMVMCTLMDAHQKEYLQREAVVVRASTKDAGATS